MTKKSSIEILVNFSQLKNEEEELFSQGEKLLKSLIKESKAFFPSNLSKTFKVNMTNIDESPEKLDLSKYKGFILDPLTLSLVKNKISNVENLNVLLFNHSNANMVDLLVPIHGIFGIDVGTILEEKFSFFETFMRFVFFLLKAQGVYKEEDFTYTIYPDKTNIYLKTNVGSGFLIELKNIFRNIKRNVALLDKVRENYKLYTYKLREKNVIKDKKRRQEEILKSLLEYSVVQDVSIFSLPSVLFVYKSSIERDIFRKWFFNEFLSNIDLHLPYVNFSAFSSEDSRDLFGFIPVNLEENDIKWGMLFENQGSIVILDELPETEEFFERLSFYVKTKKLVPYGRRVEVPAPFVLISFIDRNRFIKYRKYLSFPYIWDLPHPLPNDNILTFVSNTMFMYNREYPLKITYEALSFLKVMLNLHGEEVVVSILGTLFFHLDPSFILTKRGLQDFFIHFI